MRNSASTLLAAYYVCATKVDFPATEAPGVRGVLHLYYKTRLSSHGSSGCSRRTTFVLQKSTFQPRKLRASAAYYICTRKVDFPATEAPGVPGVLHLNYKVDFPATTEAPGVRGVLQLYYTSRLPSHGSPRRTTSVLQKTQNTTVTVSVPRPREDPQRGYVCMSRNAKNTTVFAPRQRRNPQRGYVCMSKTQKHDGFGTAPTRKPAEGCLRPRKKVQKNDGFSTATRRLLAEGCPRTERNVKKRRFKFSTATTVKPAEGCPRPERNVKTTVLAPRPRRNPQRVAIPIGDVNPARRLRKSNVN